LTPLAERWYGWGAHNLKKRSPVKLWLYDGAFSQPDTAVEFVDDDAEWTEILSEPEVVTDKAKKTAAPAVCGAEYRPGATSKEQSGDNLHWSHALVLDVDYYEHPATSRYPSRAPFTPDELKARMDELGVRYIAFTTWSSSASCWKWRVVVPFSSPMPPTYYGPLWDVLNEHLEGTMSEATRDVGRLGFVHIVNSETNKDAYRWWIGPGERLDWSALGLVPESDTAMKRALTPADLTRSPDWSSDAEAMAAARRYFKNVGADVEEGNRHETLLRVGCKLWWDWALNEDQVREILTLVNGNFPTPKGDADVEAEIAASHERTLGARRVEQPASYGEQREPVAKLTKTAIADLGKRLKFRNREQDRVVGRALVNVSKEKAFGEPTEAQGVIMRSVEVLAREYNHETPERVLDLLRASLLAQRALSAQHPVPSDGDVLNKVRHTQSSMRQRLDERQRTADDKRKQDIRQGTGGRRDEPYTEKELRAWRSRGFGDRDWIVKSGRSYYFWVDGKYDGEWDESSAAVVVYTKLAAACGREPGRLKLQFVDKEGNERDKPFPQIMREYGRAAKNVVYSMFEEHPRFDEVSQTFYNSICEVDPTLEAKYDADIDEWIGLLGQDKAELLRDWLAASVLLDNSISALHIATPTNSGKNLIVNGLARLWHGHYQNLRDYSPLLLKDSPLVFCDEGLPYKWLYSFSTLLRAMTSQSIHTARDTGFSTLRIHGYPRLIFAGNDALVQFEQEKFSTDALEATTKRLVSIVHTDRGAKDFLEQPHIKAKIPGWVAGGFARHALWMNEHRVIDTKKRFLVEDTRATELIAGVTSKVADRMFRWIYTSLATGEFNSEALFAKVETDGKKILYLNAPALMKNWTLCMPERDRPKPFEVQNSLHQITPRRATVTISTASSKKERYRTFRIVDLDPFREWVKENDLDLDLDDSLETLAKVRTLK
jgi:hypothetical protein